MQNKEASHAPHAQAKRIRMSLHVFLLFFLFFFMLSLAQLCSLCWPHHCPAQSAAAARRSPVHRLRHRHAPSSLSSLSPLLYPLKTPSHQIGMVLTVRAFGQDPSEASRVLGYRQATITSLSDSCRPCTHRPCMSASSATSGSRTSS